MRISSAHWEEGKEPRAWDPQQEAGALPKRAPPCQGPSLQGSGSSLAQREGPRKARRLGRRGQGWAEAGPGDPAPGRGRVESGPSLPGSYLPHFKLARALELSWAHRIVSQVNGKQAHRLC